MNLMNSKRAQGANYIAVIVAIVLFGFLSILAYTIWLQFVTAITVAGYNVGTVAETINNFSRAFRAPDYLIVLFTVLLIIGIGLTSFKLPTRTAFFIVTVIFGLFWGFISYFFNYVFIQMVSPEVFAVALGVFPRTLALCTHLHWIMLIEIVVGSLALYGKKEKGQFLS